MNLNKYTMLIKTCELGSVTAAAKELGISQSAATQLINSLEKELGLQIIVRSRSGVRLTKEGSILLPLFKNVVEADNKISSAVQKLKSEKNIIRIAAFKSVAINWLPEIIRDFRKANPGIKIELIDCGYKDIDQSLMNEDVDFAFLPLPANPAYTGIPVYNDRLLAVLPPDYPQTGLINGRLPVKLFETEPVVSLSDSIDRDARTVFHNAGIVPNICYRVDDDYAQLAMIENGLGIGIVPELILHGTDKKLKISELDPPAFRTIGIAFPSYKNASTEALAFSEFAKNYISHY